MTPNTPLELVLSKTLAGEIGVPTPKEMSMRINIHNGMYGRVVMRQGSMFKDYYPYVGVESYISRAERTQSWSDVDFFKGRSHESLNECNLSPFSNCLYMNKNPKQGCPYLIYSHNGLEYCIRQEKLVDNTDTTTNIILNQHPKKIGLFGQLSLFMMDNGIELLHTNQQAYTIPTIDAVDVGIPDAFQHLLPVLRRMPGNAPINTRCNGFLDIVDLEAGKMQTYHLKSTPRQKSYAHIASTWHPHQYIYATQRDLFLTDTREKSSQQVLSLRFTSYGGRPNSKNTAIPYIVSIHKTSETKVVAVGKTKLAVLDLRYPKNPFDTLTHPIDLPRASVSKNIAIYNKAGHFYFQNLKNLEKYAFKSFVLGENEKSAFVAFDWYGKGLNHNYTSAAFLFTDHIKLFHHSGELTTYPIVTMDSKVNARPLYLVDRHERLYKVNSALTKSKDIESIIFRHALLARPTKDNRYPFLTRMINHDFTNRLETPEPLTATPPAILAKIIPFSQWPGSLVPAEKRKQGATIEKYRIQMPSEHQSLAERIASNKKRNREL
ncbi:hypothetical protein NEDG_00742 [Nematocida displodere]|uniref:Uncharacterized protein n=1 Tax=Nematocida displodere TaxID=1805483 RepID=A0A177EF42_9MICR|nr:hypothetical protein NEDG_00742 [Nematocida displodere]